MKFDVFGIKGNATFSEIVSYVLSIGGNVILIDPDMIVGRDHVVSAINHAQRAFVNGTNRSRDMQMEILLYCAWERQIKKAIDKMSPKKNRAEFVAIFINMDDPNLECIGMTRDDSVMDPTLRKIKSLGLTDQFISPEDQALENVAMVDLIKH